jgi:AcrR family transcriptional regulator
MVSLWQAGEWPGETGTAMPKRDGDYMLNQRDAIAKAALSVMVEKGIHETSLRDICRAAGVSNGAFYIHFPNKEAVIVAACAIDHVQELDSDLPQTWEEYAVGFVDDLRDKTSYRSKRFRLSLQFTADLSQMDRNPAGLTAVYHVYAENIARILRRFRDGGIITLPHGLELTTQMHVQIIGGAGYQRASNRDLAIEKIEEALSKNLAVTAGLIEGKAQASLESS